VIYSHFENRLNGKQPKWVKLLFRNIWNYLKYFWKFWTKTGTYPHFQIYFDSFFETRMFVKHHWRFKFLWKAFFENSLILLLSSGAIYVKNDRANRKFVRFRPFSSLISVVDCWLDQLGPAELKIFVLLSRP